MTGGTDTPGVPCIARQLWFGGARRVEVREQLLGSPGAGELLVRTECSAVSAGTELLVYRGELPAGMPVDGTVAALQQSAAYPLQYGYASVGTVLQAGAEMASWLGRRVFAFVPHASHFLTTPDTLIPVPDDIEPEDAVFLANMETAVNLVHDGKPALGEKVVILGQGVVGLLLASLLAQFPLARLCAVDVLAERRSRALQLGVQQAFDAAAPAELARLHALLAASPAGADLVYEVSGSPAALNLAIELCGYTSRIVIGSWYGSKTAAIALGGAAHRNRLSIMTSQVSTLAPDLSGRWDKARRFAEVWTQIRTLRPRQLITQRVALAEAAALYDQLDTAPEANLQALFIHSPT
jgi:2-desacetyl-2-hydroxyethyl bacteriochlorophyllide A dehydrogenase